MLRESGEARNEAKCHTYGPNLGIGCKFEGHLEGADAISEYCQPDSFIWDAYLVDREEEALQIFVRRRRDLDQPCEWVGCSANCVQVLVEGV